MPVNYIKVGVLFKPVGTNGEIKMDIEEAFIDDFFNSDHFFVRLNGNYVPYFIENLRETNFLLVKIEEVDNPETAAQFNLKDIFLREQSIKSASFQQQQDKQGLIGYQIKSEDGVIGSIVDIEVYPHQLMAHVTYLNRVVLIPLADELISDIQHDERVIQMNLPEGLLDM